MWKSRLRNMLFDFLISLARICTKWENGDKWKIMTFAAELWAAADPVLIHENSHVTKSIALQRRFSFSNKSRRIIIQWRKCHICLAFDALENYTESRIFLFRYIQVEIDLQIEIDDAFDTVFVFVVMTEQLVNSICCVLQKSKH